MQNDNHLTHIDVTINAEDLFEEIEFCKVVGLNGPNPIHAVPLSQVYSLLTKYFPQLKTEFEWRQSQL